MNVQTMGNKGLKLLFYAICIFIVGMLGMQIATAMLGGKSNPVPIAQKNYDAATYTQCVAHSNLGSAKVNAYFDGFIDASDEDILRWKEAKEKDCTIAAFQ
jgi:hypothetical protein